MDANILVIFLVAVVSLALSLAAVAIVLKLAHKNEWYDRTSDRKIHEGDIPRLGGIGFSVVFVLVAVAIFFIYGNDGPLSQYLPCLFALILTLLIGAWDDFRPLRPIIKLLGQCVAAIIMIASGFTFKFFTYLEPNAILLPLEYAITFIWVVGLINAINFIDGLDGLAGGLSGLIVLSLGLIFIFNGEITYGVLLCAALFGVILGFLVFNLPIPKAKIFMGDGGSHVLGFMLALLPLLKEQGSVSVAPLPLLYAATLLLIPIFDTTAAVWRRVRDHKRIDSPDKAHIHHKLLNLGLSARVAVAVLYGLQTVIGVLTFVSIRLSGLASLLVLGSAYVIIIVFFSALHFMNRATVKAKKNN